MPDRRLVARRAAGCLAITIALIGGPAPAAAPGVHEGYLDADALTAAAQALARNHAACRLDAIGASRQGRGILLLTLAANPDAANDKPAILIVAGLDGRHMVGTETAMRVAGLLLRDHAELLKDVTFHIIPRANPDAAQMNLGPVNRGHITALREVDDDRDGRRDEDGPVDLNGDGVITLMRRPNPPLDDPPTHCADPAEPRLLIKPDPVKGQTAIYSLYTEGLDADGDGRIAEDSPGGVDLDRNFTHRWPEFADDAGPYQLSEPESAALASFVLARPTIVAAIVYGRHDNLINVPDGKARDVTGRAPRDLDEDDVSLSRDISKTFKDITGQKRAPGEDSAGSLHSLLYAQRGIPAFATIVWGRPDPSKPEGQEEGKDERKDKDAPKPVDEEAAEWLKYSDRDRGGAGFIAWQPFDHPTLGRVEIGGFVPGFMMNPPADLLDDLAGKQAAFAVEIASRRPRLSIVGPEVKRLAPGLYDIRVAVVNEGSLPTATAMARKGRAIPPIVVRLSTPVERIVSGDRVSRAWSIDPAGGRFAQRWIVLADDRSDLSIEIVSRLLGTRTIAFKAAEQEAAR